MPSIVFWFLNLINRPGAFQRLRWTTTVKPAAAHKHRTLTKVTTATIRTGVDYRNLAVNADRETGPLPWGEWAIHPWIITHKGEFYARLYVNDGSLRTVYFVDGEQVERDDFLALLTPSQRESKRPNGGTITVKLSNLEVVESD